jgi:hypothetical protein
MPALVSEPVGPGSQTFSMPELGNSRVRVPSTPLCAAKKGVDVAALASQASGQRG